jgi:hypothetical protein
MFDIQHGLSLHFYNSNNLFCNPSLQYQTTPSEQSLSFELLSPPNDTTNHSDKEDDDPEEGVIPPFHFGLIVPAIVMR